MIVFYGDPHGDFSTFHSSVIRDRPSAGIFVGDLDLERPFEEEAADLFLSGAKLWWIVGNHDTDAERWHDNLFCSKLADRNLNGRVVEIGGLRIAGLGGVFRGLVWDPRLGPPRLRTREEFLSAHTARWRRGLPLKHRSTIFPEDFEALSNQRADILVCHEAPSTHVHGHAIIDELALKMGVRMIIHGHHHISYEAVTHDNIHVVGLPKAGHYALHSSALLRTVRQPNADETK